MILKKLTYRPDIDGLRALAVLSVILFHINPQYMPSGFLGVDIFFVISGFLITSIIYKEMAEGTFTFANFYNRRIKRILPVFFVVLFIGLLIAWYFFLVRDYYGTANSAIMAVFFLSNIYFSRLGDYFDVAAEQRPFAHIWSLSVEEQFYFIFPLVLLFIFKNKYLKKHKIGALIVGGGILLLSSFVNLKKIGIDLDPYYLPHLRMIELLSGAILSVFLFEKGNRLTTKQSNVLGIIALLALLLFLYLKNFFVFPYFPGVLALLPCIATCLLILANEKGKYIKQLFSLKLIVWIGKISYSLYLWHWLVLAIFRYIYGSGALAIPQLIIAIILILALSVLSYYAVEQVFRYNKLSFKKNLMFFYILPSLVIVAFCYKLYKTEVPEYLMKFPHYPPIACNSCKDKETLMTFGDLNSNYPYKILFAGDSNTAHLVPFIEVVGKKEGWKADVISAGNCPFLFDYQHKETKQDCITMNEYLAKHYKEYDIIILSNTIAEDTYIPNFRQRLLNTIKKLLQEGKKVYLINSSSVYDIDLPKIKHIEKTLGIRWGIPFKGEKYQQNTQHWNVIASMVKDHFPEVKIIDFLPYIPNDGCINNIPIVLDINHLNSYGAKKIAERFIQDGKIMIK